MDEAPNLNLLSEISSSPTLILKQFQVISQGWGRRSSALRFCYHLTPPIIASTYDVVAQRQLHIGSLFEYKINRLQIPTEQRHDLQLRPSLIPSPSINHLGSISFVLPPYHQIL